MTNNAASNYTVDNLKLKSYSDYSDFKSLNFLTFKILKNLLL